MNRVLPLPLILFFIVITPSFAQDFLGKVTVTELAASSNTSFPKAKAVILNEEVQVEFEYDYEYGFRVNETVSRKIKLYDNSAKGQLAFLIPYAPKGYSKEDITISLSNIYRLVGEKVVKEKSSKESLVELDKGNWREKGVAYNTAQAGDIIEYSYTKTTSYIDELPEWYIQSDLPKEKAAYKVMVPEYFVYNIIQKGGIKLKEQDYTKRVSYRGLNGTFGNTEVNTIFKLYTAQLIPAYEVEPYLDNPSNYVATVRFDLQQVQFSRSPVEKIMQEEKVFYTDLLKSKGFGRELKQDKFLNKEIDLEEYKSLSKEEQINKVLKEVQSKVQWNNEHSIFVQNGIKTAYYKGTGNSADINLLLTAIYRHIGLKANPVLLSTRSNGVKTVWQRNYYNHVITAVEIDNQIYLIDATSPHTSANVLTLEDLNGQGSIISDNGTVMKVNLMPNFTSISTNKYQVNLMPSGVVSGQIIENYSNYEALNFREMYDGSEWKLGKWYESQNFGMTVSNTRVYDSGDNTKDVRVAFTFSKDNGVMMFNNKYFVFPFQFYPLVDNPFKQEVRNYPIYFGYPQIDNYQIGIVIPEGYQVSELPKPFTTKDTNTGLEVQTKFDVKDNQVLCTLIVVKNKGVIPAKEYDSVKATYQQLIEQLKGQVILEKK